MTDSNPPAYFKQLSPLLLILLGAAFVRIWGVWAYLPTMDEVQFLIISQGDSFGEIWRRALAEVHPPLDWYIRHCLLMISRDIFVQRLFSVLMGLLTVYGAYMLGKAVYRNRRAGQFCAFFTAFMPSMTVVSMGLRNYPFLMFFLVWALVFFVRWRRSERAHNLVLYTLFMALACASHFSGFLIAAACGLAGAARLIRQKRVKTLVLFCLSYLPLATLGLVFYHYYMAPGGTVPMWREFMLQTGYTPANPPAGFMEQIVYPLLAYFSPFLQAVYSHGLIPENLRPLAKACVLAAGIMLLVLYFPALYLMRRAASATFILTATVWIVTLGLSVADLYPFSANRHSIYLLPFLILPFAALFIRTQESRNPLPFIIVLLLAVVVDEAAIWQDDDFCLTKEDFTQAQLYLVDRLAPGDAIVTGPMGAYFYLIYDRDGGVTPYDDYGDKPYKNGTTLLAPFASPYKPFSSWQPFRDDLAQRLKNGAVPVTGNVWFVQYGWKNGEIWTLMHCRAAQPVMKNFMSREGVAIFSIRATDLAVFLEDSAAWDECYKDYKPLVVGTPFHQVTDVK